MPTHTTITEILMNAVVDALVDGLTFEEIPDNQAEDEASAGLIRAGKLQDDPTIAGINILIHPAKPDWPNVRYTPGSTDAMYTASQYTSIGTAGSYRLQRFTVELRMFFTNEFERIVAFNKAQVVLSRAENALALLNFNLRKYPRDSFGSKAHAVQVGDTFVREGGGPGTFIWRGEIQLEFLCEFEPVVNPA